MKHNTFIPRLKDSMEIQAMFQFKIWSKDWEEGGDIQPSQDEIEGLKKIAMNAFLYDLDVCTFCEFWKITWETDWTKDSPIIVKEGNVQYEPNEQVIVLKSIFNVSSILCKKMFVDTLQDIIHTHNEKSIYQFHAGNFNLIQIALIDVSHDGLDILHA